jgi:hypothetical protein
MADGDSPFRVAAISLDCTDPSVLAGFYGNLLGGRVLWQGEASVGLAVNDGMVLVTQWVEGCGGI